MNEMFIMSSDLKCFFKGTWEGLWNTPLGGGSFLSCVVDEIFIEVPILRNLSWTAKFLVAHLHMIFTLVHTIADKFLYGFKSLCEMW